MWDEDEYVKTENDFKSRVNSAYVSSPTRSKQVKISQAVKLPKNPFLDSDDYADMTGHQRSQASMDLIRSTMKHKTMKSRSQSASRLPASLDLRPEENKNVPTNSFVDTKLRSQTTLREYDSDRRSVVKRSNTSITFIERPSKFEVVEDDEKTSKVMEESSANGNNRTLKKSSISVLSMSSPISHQSSNFDNEAAQTAVVIEETKPSMLSHSTFSQVPSQQQFNDMKFFESHKQCFGCSPKRIFISIMLIVYFASVGTLCYFVVQQDNEIQRLRTALTSLHTSFPQPTVNVGTSNGEIEKEKLSTTRESGVLITSMTTSNGKDDSSLVDRTNANWEVSSNSKVNSSYENEITATDSPLVKSSTELTSSNVN